jgi:hypothetical protein
LLARRRKREQARGYTARVRCVRAKPIALRAVHTLAQRARKKGTRSFTTEYSDDFRELPKTSHSRR